MAPAPPRRVLRGGCGTVAGVACGDEDASRYDITMQTRCNARSGTTPGPLRCAFGAGDP